MASGKSRDSLYYYTAKMLSSILHLTHYKPSLHSDIKTLGNMSLTKFLCFNNVYKPPYSSQTKPDWVLIPNVPYIFPSMFFFKFTFSSPTLHHIVAHPAGRPFKKHSVLFNIQQYRSLPWTPPALVATMSSKLTRWNGHLESLTNFPCKINCILFAEGHRLCFAYLFISSKALNIRCCTWFTVQWMCNI